MSKPRKATIEVLGAAISIITDAAVAHRSLTDIAKFKNPDHPDDVIHNWLRNRNTLEFLSIWERLNNPASKPVEFDGIRMQAGLNSFPLTPKQRSEQTVVIGISSKPGRYGGTYDHHNTAFEFAALDFVKFKL